MTQKKVQLQSSARRCYLLGMNARECRFFLKLGISPVCALSAAILQTIAFSASSLAQELKPVADDTLGAESSVVTPTSPQADRIDGGAIRGANLFHSFSQFNIGEGREAYFANPSGISNILSRVTGSDASRIFGKLGVLGNANLFLINPNGIIFGKNASLDVRGSFVGTTANAIQFGDRGFFSATNPNTPELLTINPSAFFFNQIAAAPIQNNSQASAGTAPIGLPTSGLRVPDGQSLLLLGGNVSLDGGRIRAYGGRVELGGLSSEGTVGLQVNGNNLSLSFPAESTRADVSLTNGASVRVDAAGGGSIVVNARNLDILGGSFLGAGIGDGLGSVGSTAGDITLDATGEIKVVGSDVFNNVRPQAVGNGGNIIISSGSLSLTDDALLSASTGGQGNAGSINVRIINSVSLEDSSYIFNSVERGGVGNGGDINISATTLSLTNGAQLQTLIRQASSNQPAGRGEAGNVNIDVTGAVTIAGEKDGLVSAVISQLGTGAIGKGGNITISSSSLSLTDGAALQASTFGQGNAGSVNVDAIDSVSLKDAGILTTVESGGIGNGGDININAASLSLTDGAELVTAVREASSNQPAGRGKAGNVNVNATGAVTIAGSKDELLSAIFSRLATGAIGKGGNITIFSGSLSLTDGAALDTSTSGQGDAGSINVRTINSVSLKDASIFNSVETGAVGNGGDINISAATLSLADSAQLVTAVREASSNQPAGQGEAGDVNIDVTGAVTITGEKDGLVSAINSSLGRGALGKGGQHYNLLWLVIFN
ncbi:MAG: filamentous hemagglutinin N-terminal domain-containing protein [Scytonema sp. CRU_2_7]|nr:filamentous hemagglutinin N-terminal domain-containing protein [Scytonema sp. CRU_2_7]